MNHILRDVLDIFVISYLDDILIYSKTQEEHLSHVAKVLDILKTQRLCLKASKCAFVQKKVEFCGHFVGSEGLEITPSKIKAMQVRPHCKNISDLQKFLGSAVWFHDFIMDFASIAEPLTRLLSPKIPWHWGAEQEEAVTLMIYLITSAPVLKFFDPSLKTFIYTDASDFAIGGWLS
jgi:hypothetical protein